MITPLFALFDPATDTSLEKISVILGGLAAFAWYMKQLFFGEKETKVRMAHDFVDQKTFLEHVRDNTESFKEVSRQRNDDQKEGSISRKALYQKMDDMEKEIHAMPEKVIQNIVNAQRVGRLK